LPASGGEEALVNLNTASFALLDTLPGVGLVTANRIIDHRLNVGPFQRIEELLETKIVNASTFDKIKGRITAP
jgi:competence protein ComEA